MKFIKSILIIFTLFIISGCNIYKQVVIPTPYYPSQEESTLGQEAGSGVAPQPTEPIEQPTPPPNQKVSEEINTIKQDTIKSVDRTLVKRIPFPVDEYQSLPKTGNATIKGKIYIITPGGQKVYGKRTRLYLNPVTSYSTQWYKESYLGGAKMSKVDPRLFNYLKFTTSDDKGNFEFNKIPSGSYYLIGVIKCGQECGYERERTIRIAKKISVFGNEVKEEDLYLKL
ncbi:MAG: carboxypeptidase regulatory-like domain-containing protein [Epsilonproteobacteria bacterium]|nr:carboxypeptidase regulatory-like domain-containing protein [Campylobacterota bacterium]